MLPTIYIIGGITPFMEAQLVRHFTLIYDAKLEDSAKWLAEHGADVRYVLTNGHDGIASDYIDAMPHVKLISNYGVGYDAIDVSYMRDKDIIVTHTPDVLNEEVATTALMLMLSCYREFRYNEAHARTGAWEKDGNARLSRSADNRVVGIVGLGRIGTAIARKLEAFNAEIIYHNRNEKQVPYRYFDNLIEMAEAADTLIVITPGGASTNALISKEVFEALGPEGVFINVARGSVVDEPALISALETKTIAAAGLDVFAAEPHIPDQLKILENVVLLPHIGSATEETRAAMGQLTVDNIICYEKTGAVHTPVPETAEIATVAKRG